MELSALHLKTIEMVGGESSVALAGVGGAINDSTLIQMRCSIFSL